MSSFASLVILPLKGAYNFDGKTCINGQKCNIKDIGMHFDGIIHDLSNGLRLGLIGVCDLVVR